LSAPTDNQIYAVPANQFSPSPGTLGRNRVNLIVGWSGVFLFFVVPRQFSQDIGEWPQNQILIPDWTYLHCPGATLVPANQFFPSASTSLD